MEQNGENLKSFEIQHHVTCFTLYPVFALVSINITLSSLALCSPSSVVICLKREMQMEEKVTGH